MEVNQAIKWMKVFNNTIQEHQEYLSELDTPIGDGDHGSNMARGMSAVVEALESQTFATAQDVFKTVAMKLLSEVGGASGPLYGSAFMGMAQGIANGSLEDSLQSGLDMIVKRGKAQVGDKTMVDVWQPAIISLKNGDLSNEKIDQFVNDTKPMVAKKGRASYVGERSVDHIDPGSFSSGLLFKALLEVGE